MQRLRLSLILVIISATISQADDPTPSVKDVAKNPEIWTKLALAGADAVKMAELAKGWSDDEVAVATKDYIFSTVPDWKKATILESLGERTLPEALWILKDSSVYGALTNPAAGDQKGPFGRACWLLGNIPPPSAVDALAPFLNEPSERIRSVAAMAIASTGAPSIVPLVQKVFSDPDENVHNSALLGLQDTLDRKGLAETTKQELFPSVLKLLEDGKNGDYGAKVLFELNPEKAKEYFLSPDCFYADSPVLNGVLETLVEANVNVPRDRLLDLISSLETKQMVFQWSDSLGKALQLLGEQMKPEDRDFLRQRLSSPVEEVAKGACEGLISSYGLQDFEARLDKKMLAGTLTRQQELYDAVEEFDAEFKFGGLVKYFESNGSASRWPDAVAGFEAMGMTERLTILKEAVSLFGKDGPSTDNPTRQDQLAIIMKKNDTVFDALDARYRKSLEIVHLRTLQYVLANPDAFR